MMETIESSETLFRSVMISSSVLVSQIPLSFRSFTHLTRVRPLVALTDEDEARMKIYSVSTVHYFGFGATVSEELASKIEHLPEVFWVLPDTCLKVKGKDDGGELFLYRKVVPFYPKDHEEWSSTRDTTPDSNNMSRNFKRRENMQSRDFLPNQPGGMPHIPNLESPEGVPPNNNMHNPGKKNKGGMLPNINMQNPGQNMGGMLPNDNMHPDMGKCTICRKWRTVQRWRCALPRTPNGNYQ
ncbi:hypothetical protein MKW94_027629 [Papaver nudicaule]|uniref:MORF/ORRM1/DAG-like MORF domain-containing protein n=1 Tax=Papaver nudicaule TaxID=74823 RepID=A0AA41RT09_PAPNU|nr:hypothetical protein [Papaver nudicaule]